MLVKNTINLGNIANTRTGTNSIAIFREELHGRDVYLIDTPGFDVSGLYPNSYLLADSMSTNVSKP